MAGHHPPAWFLAALVAVAVLGVGAPGPEVVPGPLRWLALPLVVLGVGLNVLADGRFERKGIPVRPGSPSPALDTGGVFARTRNPMYLGMVLVVLGAALGFGALAPLAVPPAFALLLDRAFIRPEEELLERRFGAEYDRYRARVRRWV